MELWFAEKLELQKGSSLAVKIKEQLYSGKSKYQAIDVFVTEMYGRMLVIDGVIMLTESDEYAYHEMIVHVPMQSHKRPQRVLVIGGGDGGCIREIVKYKEVKEIHLCEIDKEVVNISKKYLPGIASGYDDPRVTVYYEDGSVFLKEKRDRYDVIIVDSTDPIGPGKALFTKEFSALIKKISVKTELPFLNANLSIFMKTLSAMLYQQEKNYFQLCPITIRLYLPIQAVL